MKTHFYFVIGILCIAIYKAVYGAKMETCRTRKTAGNTTPRLRPKTVQKSTGELYPKTAQKPHPKSENFCVLEAVFLYRGTGASKKLAVKFWKI